jgi:hypothetical protein
MKHLSFLTFLFLMLLAVAKAAPGDTTVVQSGHTATQLANFGNYNASAVFPTTTTTYRNIQMTFTLGKYQCPGSPQYCGDWDYTVQVYLYTPTDTFELGRLMTPYANVSRFPWNWQHRYNFNVTDYAQYLKGNTTIRIHYSGYSGGFTSNIKFTFIEGTPPRNVVKIKRLWNGSIGYGNSAAVETKMNNRTLQMPAGSVAAELKFNVTGHGGNANDNCSEFCSKYYQVKVNNSLISQTNIWRDNCGNNNLYPQTGTWIYERANWCPGDVVYPNFHPISGVTAGGNFNLDVDFQPYSNPTSQASYTVEGQIIYYGAYNFTADASLETIVAPSDHEANFRANPVCEEAKVKVKNTGSVTIISLEMIYGLTGGTMNTASLATFIEPGTTEEIILPGNTDFVTMGNGVAEFSANIAKVNGNPDANLLNNKVRSKFTPMPVWPNEVIIRLITNNGGYNANNWKLFDSGGNLVRQRVNTTNATTYMDTLALPVGCYRLEVDDRACNGLQWWAAPSQGSGSMLVRYKNSNQPIPLKGYFSGDFGCGFTQAFRVQTVLGTKEEKTAFNFFVFPNPGNGLFQVILPEGKAYQFTVTDLSGRVVKKQVAIGGTNQLNLEGTAKGIYLLHVSSANGQVVRKLMVE